MPESFDIIIIGGGMVGAQLAATLAHSNLSIAVVEAVEPRGFKKNQPYDLRVSAVSIASQRMFEAVGAWESILDRRVCPYRQMLVWDSEGSGETLFDSGDVYEPVLGHIVENLVIQFSLVEAVKRHENVEWICPDGIVSIQDKAEGVSITLSSGRSLSTRLLIGADGAASKVRSLSEIEIDKIAYNQHALVATIETQMEQQDITWQRFVPSGPQALLPLEGSRASMVWYNSAEEVDRLKALPDEDFIMEMENTFPQRLGGIKSIIGRGSFPLIKSHAKNYIKNRVVLVGDAAHTIHPLAGQGVNLGLMDAAVLAEIILHHHNKGADCTTHSVLRKYERARRGHNSLMIGAMDVFHHTFKSQQIPVKLARNLALKIPEKTPLLRNFVMKYAMGLAGELPLLARGQIPG